MNAKTLRSVSALVEAGLVAPAARAALDAVAQRYAVSVTPAMARLIVTSDVADPIARQFLPTEAELLTALDESADPIGDYPHMPVKGLVHRYADRVLLKATHTCPVYCRFCFRRAMVGPDGDGALTPAEIDAALAYVASQPQVREVILTGGDPFVLSDRRIGAITRGVAAIGHVVAIRWHTRVPVVDPGRVTPALVSALTDGVAGRKVRVAVHANHAREFTAAARAALARLAASCVHLISQSVLLRGVNDEVEALAALMGAFAASGVAPYYLHQGDLAPGTGHFRVPMDEGLALLDRLRARIGDDATPAYVIDLPGGFGKVPVANGMALGGGRYQFRDRTGRTHAYPPDATCETKEKAAAVSG